MVRTGGTGCSRSGIPTTNIDRAATRGSGGSCDYVELYGIIIPPNRDPPSHKLPVASHLGPSQPVVGNSPDGQQFNRERSAFSGGRRTAFDSPPVRRRIYVRRRRDPGAPSASHDCMVRRMLRDLCDWRVRDRAHDGSVAGEDRLHRQPDRDIHQSQRGCCLLRLGCHCLATLAVSAPQSEKEAPFPATSSECHRDQLARPLGAWHFLRPVRFGDGFDRLPSRRCVQLRWSAGSVYDQFSDHYLAPAPEVARSRRSRIRHFNDLSGIQQQRRRAIRIGEYGGRWPGGRTCLGPADDCRLSMAWNRVGHLSLEFRGLPKQPDFRMGGLGQGAQRPARACGGGRGRPG